MELGGLLAVALTAGVLAGAIALVARGPETLAGGLFHAEQPGWPHGIQEDDDVRWRWTGWPPAPRDRETRDPPDPVRVQPLVPVVRVSGQPRSDARARS